MVLLFRVEFNFSGERDVSVNAANIALRQSPGQQGTLTNDCTKKRNELGLSLENIKGTEKSLNLEMGPNGS